jgi:LysM repeat protein
LNRINVIKSDFEMFRTRYLFGILILILSLDSCRPARQAMPSVVGEANATSYIEKYKDLAISEMRRTGVPASITLAQGMIESDFGRSTLAREGNNHFGIKCHGDWTGQVIRHNDDRRNECFRKYRQVEESYYDHSDFLRNGSRYTSLFSLSPTDYKGWARGLKQAGYATNPDYANMLIRNIEKNNLYYYDKPKSTGEEPELAAAPYREPETAIRVSNEGPGERPADGTIALPSRSQRVMENNRIQYIIVKEGETPGMLEEEFQMLKWELSKYNELSSDFTPKPGQMLYLQPKRDKAEPGRETHSVSEGDTMYSISQKYGMKVRKLYEYNRMAEGEEPVAGTKVWLRVMKPVN